MLSASSPRYSPPLLSSLSDSLCAYWLAVESAVLIIHYLLTLASPLVFFSLRVCVLAFHCVNPLFKDICPSLFADVKIAGLGLFLPPPLSLLCNNTPEGQHAL